MKKRKILLIIIIIGLLISVGLILSNTFYKSKNKTTLLTNTTLIPKENIQSIPLYINNILLVNKNHPLPANFTNKNDYEAETNVKQLINDAQKQGLNISSQYSGFRSTNKQAQLYHDYVLKDGEVAANLYSAKPTYSEHESGLAYDLIDYQNQLVDHNPENQWIANNAYKYGFIIRYPQNKETITGYQYEPWHLRYVGKKVATEIYQKQQCLEEYLQTI